MKSSPPHPHPRFFNRELSWLAFNERVLEEASDRTVPLMERLRFLGITASNLDEFYMVRVGGLSVLAQQGRSRPDISGLSPRQQLHEIASRVQSMVARQYQLWNEELAPALARAGLRRLRWSDLTSDQLQHVQRIWANELEALLTPCAVNVDRTSPTVAGLTLHLAVRLRRSADGPWPPGEGWAWVAIPRSVPRFYFLPDTTGQTFVMVEDIVRGMLSELFPGVEILDTALFRVTRNADLTLAEDMVHDLLSGMEDVLAARRASHCVRLELEAEAPPVVADWLRQWIEVDPEHVFRIPGPLALADLRRLADVPGFELHRYPPWPPVPPPGIRPNRSMFEQIAEKDWLIHVPFESYEPVVRFIEEAAEDPDVLAIKQTLYRTSRDSPIIAALERAAEAGKHVTAVVELRARFDEEQNIEWARALERAGVEVIHGVRGFKVHAKVCLVVRHEAGRIRRYVHFGTGNYNERTARQYCDLNLLTAADDYGADAAAFFNVITGLSQPPRFHRIEMAPLGIRRRLLELIEGERIHREAGRPARIMAKMNSLADPELIEALYRASQAGVPIDLSVRGICCLRPGVPGLSPTIRVTSVVDRFLEHARIFYFERGGEPAIFLSSADWMPRNLDKRVELMVEVVEPEVRRQLERILEISLSDNVKARELRPDGTYMRPKPAAGDPKVRSQEKLYRLALKAARAAQIVRKHNFEPYRPAQASKKSK